MITYYKYTFIQSVDQGQFKFMLNQYLRHEMVRDGQALAGLNDQMVGRLFEKVRNIFRKYRQKYHTDIIQRVILMLAILFFNHLK